MRKTKTNVIEIDDFRPEARTGMALGRIIDVSEEGQIIIDYAGNILGPLPARFISIGGDQGAASFMKDAQVMLIFEHDNPRLPIIVGLVQDRLQRAKTTVVLELDREAKREVVVDKQKKTIIEAKEEIELRCGKSSLVLKENGKVVIKGIEIVSRAARTNKIKGASVSIN
jgi:hypothetical protein